MGQVMGHPSVVGNQPTMPDGNSMQIPNTGMVTSTMMPGMGQPRFQANPGNNPRYPSNMPMSNQMQSMMSMQGSGHPPETMSRKPTTQLKQALIQKHVRITKPSFKCSPQCFTAFVPSIASFHWKENERI